MENQLQSIAMKQNPLEAYVELATLRVHINTFQTVRDV